MSTAEEHLEDIYDFLAQDNLKVAADIYNTIIEETDKLSAFPEMAMKELSLQDETNFYRSLIVNRKYKVVYRFSPKSEEIIVVSVWDCRQEPETLTKKIAKRR